MRLLGADRMRRADRLAAERFGVPTLDLMRRAGEKAALLARRRMEEESLSRAVVVCGKGNNGGDGLAAALHLHRAGVAVEALLAVPFSALRGDAERVLQDALRESVPVSSLEPQGIEQALRGLGRAVLLVDAVFGTGFRPPAGAPWDLVIAAVNASGTRVLSIDLPSGTDADRGAVDGPAVKADWTVTLGAAKPSLFLHPAAALAGMVTLADIGHPPELLAGEDEDPLLIEAGFCRERILRRPADGHKGTFGHLLAVCGSRRYPGAALLAALGGARGGAGLVSLACPGDLAWTAVPLLPEILPLGLPAGEDGALGPDAGAAILEAARGKEAVVIGPGMTRCPEAGRAVRRTVEELPLPLVIDADALILLAEDPAPLSRRNAPAVITPHPGELAALLGRTAAGVQADRPAAALEAARRLGCVTVLKGAGTIVALPEGRFLVNVSGNPGMASGGMGDILAGLIGSLLAQGAPPAAAAALGAYLHGLAGDLAADEVGPAGFNAREVADRIPSALQTVLEGHEDVDRT